MGGHLLVGIQERSAIVQDAWPETQAESEARTLQFTHICQIQRKKASHLLGQFFASVFFFGGALDHITLNRYVEAVKRYLAAPVIDRKFSLLTWHFDKQLEFIVDETQDSRDEGKTNDRLRCLRESREKGPLTA